MGLLSCNILFKIPRGESRNLVLSRFSLHNEVSRQGRYGIFLVDGIPLELLIHSYNVTMRFVVRTHNGPNNVMDALSTRVSLSVNGNTFD